jgi:hypothetical protein
LRWRIKVEPAKVVARYSDGRIVKGFTHDFLPNRNCFHLYQTTKGSGGPVEVLVKELKAVFHVRDFKGNPFYEERKVFWNGEKPSGRKVEVTFLDGEVLVGSTLGYDSERQGFFFFPADPRSNNTRVFAVSSAVKQVRYV